MIAFSDDERKVFVYENHKGEKVHADPLVVQRKLLRASAGQYDRWLAECQPTELPVGSEEWRTTLIAREDALEKVVNSVREAFDLPAVDPAGKEPGATEEMVLRVIREFTDFVTPGSDAATAAP